MVKPHNILQFWFEESGQPKWPNNMWYAKSDAFDAEIRMQFEDFAVSAAAQVKQYGRHDWMRDPEPSLALIIALDQFPRNMYRDTKAAFAWDGFALACADNAIGQGHDLKIGQDKRAFFYMPYMHAEDLAMQDECVRLMDMCIDAPSSLFHAQEHRKLIENFGRFPHRNAILSRESTDVERAFLAQGGYSP